MGKIKKFFSKSSWESSDFGGFSQLLWDLPEMKMPYGFNITAADKSQYISPYSEKKLLAVFINAVNKYGYQDTFLESCKAEKVQTSYGYGIFRSSVVYTFNKESVKACLRGIIKNEKELASLFTNYSNLISNSTITYKISLKDEENPEDYLSIGTSTNDFLKGEINSVEKQTRSNIWGDYKSSSGCYETLKKSTTFRVMSELDSDHHYDSNEVKNSEKLLNLLDISFDQDETKITNLRTGKIDIPKIAEAIAGNHLINFRKELHDRTKPFSVCILNDESGSMDYSGYKDSQHSITKMLYLTFSQIMDPKDIYIYGHTGGNVPEIHVYNDKYNQIFEKAYARQHRVNFSENYDGPVIDSIYDKIRSYTDKNILFIVISDGSPAGFRYGSASDRDDLKRIVEKCKRDGFVACGIGFNYTGVQELYKYNTVVTEMSKAPEAISMLINNVVKSEFQ